jgi:hypothetical protein
VATLKGDNSMLSTGVSVSREEKTVTASDGSWTLSLIANTYLGSESYYVIKIGSRETYEVVVPTSSSSTPVSIPDILKGVPVAPLEFFYTGDIKLTGDLLVQGDLTVSGAATYGSLLDHYVFSTSDIPTFPGSLTVTGNLAVSGTVKTKGIVTAGG